MKTYFVQLTRLATESCGLAIDAESREEAEKIALEMVGPFGEKEPQRWELDEGNLHRVEVTG